MKVNFLNIIAVTFLLLGQKYTSTAQNDYWARNITGSGSEFSRDIKVDNNGYVYIAGSFSGTADFNPGIATRNITSSINDDGYILKLDSLGDYVWVKRIVGSGYIYLSSIVFDQSNNFYITGSFEVSADFDMSSQIHYLTASNRTDGFIAKYDSNGTLLWAHKLGGNGRDDGRSLALDNLGNIYVTGAFSGTVDFNPGSGTTNLTSAGGFDIYVCKFSSNGNFIWAKSIGGTQDDYPLSITSDVSNNLLIAGYFNGSCDFNPDTGSYILSNSGSKYDAFTLKLTATGKFRWAKSYGDIDYDEARVINSDSYGNVYTSGSFKGTVNFDSTNRSNSLTSLSDDLFLLKQDSSGNFMWVKQFSTNLHMNPTDLLIDENQELILSARFIGTANLDTNHLNIRITAPSASLINSFTCKLDTAGFLKEAYHFNSETYQYITGIDLYRNSMYVCGFYKDSVSFTIGQEDTIMYGNSNYDVFIYKREKCLPYFSEITTTSCNSYLSPSGKYTWNKNGTYNDTIFGNGDCDSILQINLTILFPTNNTINIASCDSFASFSGKYIWNQSGAFHDTIQNTVGCDSIILINLQIANTTYSTISDTACSYYLSPSGTYSWNETGSYNDTIVNALGCDSIITINLQINNSTAIINKTECAYYTSPSGKYTWDQSGSYIDTITNILGCDSILSINLSLNNSSSEIYDTSCYLYTSPSGNYVWDSTGQYIDTILNSNACDSSIIVNLTIGKSNAFINETVCDSLLSPSRKYIWRQTGFYKDTILNSIGCDSIIDINLIVNSFTGSIINNSTCTSYLSPSGNYVWSQTGTYFDTISNALGCDSIIEIHLKINSSSSIIKDTVCRSYTSPSGKYTWNQSGTYFDTIPNSLGCDSLITLDLIITAIDTSISQNGYILSSNEPNSKYQWLNCNQGYSKMLNDTNQTFAASSNGMYAVEVSGNQCIDTSACVSVLTVDLNDMGISEFVRVYPNPTSQNLYIENNSKDKSEITYTLYNTKGQVLLTSKMLKRRELLHIEGAKGIYFLEVKFNDTTEFVKIVKN